MTSTSATSTPAQPGDRRELVITHTYIDGTLLTGSPRNDDLYRLLRSHGWLYPAQHRRLPDRPAKTGPIGRTAPARVGL